MKPASLKSLNLAYIAALDEYHSIPDRRASEKDTALMFVEVAKRNLDIAKEARSEITRLANARSAKFAPRAS